MKLFKILLKRINFNLKKVNDNFDFILNVELNKEKI